MTDVGVFAVKVLDCGNHEERATLLHAPCGERATLLHSFRNICFPAPLYMFAAHGYTDFVYRISNPSQAGSRKYARKVVFSLPRLHEFSSLGLLVGLYLPYSPFRKPPSCSRRLTRMSDDTTEHSFAVLALRHFSSLAWWREAQGEELGEGRCLSVRLLHCCVATSDEV